MRPRLHQHRVGVEHHRGRHPSTDLGVRDDADLLGRRHRHPGHERRGRHRKIRRIANMGSKFAHEQLATIDEFFEALRRDLHAHGSCGEAQALPNKGESRKRKWADRGPPIHLFEGCDPQISRPALLVRV